MTDETAMEKMRPGYKKQIVNGFGRSDLERTRQRLEESRRRLSEGGSHDLMGALWSQSWQRELSPGQIQVLEPYASVERGRRMEMGLTQAHTAALSGLSRQTIDQAETGTVPELGFNKVDRLATVLGLTLRVHTGNPAGTLHRRMTPLMRAAATAGVSYRTKLSPARLKRIVETGKAPDAYAPHVHALLDDAPVSLLTSMAEQLEAETGMSRDVVWKRYRGLAQQVQSRRNLWQRRDGYWDGWAIAVRAFLEWGMGPETIIHNLDNIVETIKDNPKVDWVRIEHRLGPEVRQAIQSKSYQVKLDKTLPKGATGSVKRSQVL